MEIRYINFLKPCKIYKKQGNRKCYQYGKKDKINMLKNPEKLIKTFYEG